MLILNWNQYDEAAGTAQASFCGLNTGGLACFVLHDGGGGDASRFIQARWQMFEKLTGMRPPVDPMGQVIFRRVTDLSAWAAVLGKRPAVVVRLPTPEEPPGAFFVAVVLLVPLDQFGMAQAGIGAAIHRSAPWPEESLLTPLRQARGRVFTLERSAALEGARATERGPFCEWTADGVHLNAGLHVPTTSEAFMDAVDRALALGSVLPAATSSSPSNKTVTIFDRSQGGAPPDSLGSGGTEGG